MQEATEAISGAAIIGFLAQLKARGIERVATAYVVTGWLLIQGASIVFPTFAAPAWALRVFVVAVFAIFPFVIWIAWVATPEPSVRHLHAAGKWTRGDFVLLSLVAALLLISLAQMIFIRRPAPEAALRAPAAEEASIAVLPFENLSSDKDTGYFADGIQDEILTRLAKIRELKVISRTSTQQFASRPGNLRAIARQLGVANVLEGSVQKVGDKVRIDVQLIRAASDDHVWAEIYDRRLTDVFSVESDVAAAVANTLATQITPKERAAIAARLTANAQAYDDYLRGLSAFRRNDNPGLLKAIGYFRQAAEADSHFVQAWTHLSRVSAYYYFSGGAEQARSDALAALSRAQTLDPRSADVQLAQGFYLYYVDRDFPAALRQFQMVSANAPNNSDVLSALGQISRRMGQWSQSIAYFRRAVAVDPLELRWRLALSVDYLLTHDYDADLKNTAEGLKHWPDNAQLLGARIEAFLHQGDLQQAGAAMAIFDPDSPGPADEKVDYLWLSHRYRDGVGYLTQTLSDAQAAHVAGSDLAGIYAQLAEFQRAAGDTSAARSSYAKALALCREQAPSDDPDLLSILAWVHGGLGDRQIAEQYADRAIALERNSKDALQASNYAELRAGIAAHFNDGDRAVPMIARLLATPSNFSPAILRLSADFDALRNDPRFRKLEAQPVVVYR